MFIVCGEALFDVFIAEDVNPSATVLPLSAQAGGSPFNVAIGLRRLGQSVALLTGISDDFLGDRLMAVLEAEHVSTHLIARKHAPTTLGLVQKNADGVPNYAFYGNGAADRLVDLADINKDIQGVKGIHLGSYSLVVSPTADTLLTLAQQQSGKCLLTLDPNVRLNVEPNLDIWRKRISQLVPLMDVVKISIEDLESLYPNVEPDSILQGWLTQGVKLVALTRGAEGALLWSHQARIELPAPTIKVVDTVGAGDTFQAVLIDKLLELGVETADWQQKLNATVLTTIGQTAIQAAAITCSRQGADMPSQAEVQHAMEQLLREGGR